ncbi:dimeric alpha-beta barrel protein [Rutstroemia sp. NJR-2017a WRK4]|nr:dimeric alpha-beta barrel protein [Rutstroemia sp. NJR-2017a WRK4]
MTELSPTQPEASTQPIKFTVTHYRLPQHTHEEFLNWIISVRLPAALPVFKKHGVLRYALFTTPSTLNLPLAQYLQKGRPTWGFADYDCVIEYTLPSVQSIAEIMSDPDWQEAIKDQEDWVDVSRALVSVGFYTPYLVEGGKFVNLGK